jgi:redox-sensing transcriptional repressor
MEPKPVSRKLLKRLPVYLNYLKNLPEDSPNISATTMARALELGDVQVRKDLGKISIGRSRTGRNRQQLMQDIEEYLNFAEETGTIIVGAGKLGRTLLNMSVLKKQALMSWRLLTSSRPWISPRAESPSIPSTGWSTSASTTMSRSV